MNKLWKVVTAITWGIFLAAGLVAAMLSYNPPTPHAQPVEPKPADYGETPEQYKQRMVSELNRLRGITDPQQTPRQDKP